MRILAIDGGGIRGMIPAIVLAEIERRTGRRAADLFDLIAGIMPRMPPPSIARILISGPPRR